MRSLIKMPLCASIFMGSFALCIQFAHAALAYSPVSKVTEIYSLTEFGGGDVVFLLSQTTTACDGYWLRAGDDGFKNAYAALLANHVSERSVSVVAYDDSLWTGSSAKYCRVYYIRST